MSPDGNRRAIAQYEATILLIVISISLASLLYGELKLSANIAGEPVFVNTKTLIGGSLEIERVTLNSSLPTSISSLNIDGASSAWGVLAFDGSTYANASQICVDGSTTFFSVFAATGGPLHVTTDGQSWISGAWGSERDLSPGWNEVMIVRGTQCSITLPDGQTIAERWVPSSISPVSSIPIEGQLSGRSFTFWLPTALGSSHQLLVTSIGGFDTVSL